MSDNPQISAPGSSTYDSKTLHVGDGTWDAERDDFLLPNLMGLNFATMQYNGMGNRFRDLPEYHTLIKGHGILAAITFLFIVPLAIFVARFGWANPRLALRLHIWLQILTVFLSTVVLTLGWFAVGPNRSLTNPHHGIGVAIYVLIMFQAIYGWLVRKIEKGRVIWRVSIKLMLHQWIGRATALLAIAQVPLGLTLYGSPKSLFIVYALWMFFLFTLWFLLTHRYQGGAGGDGTGSYFSDRRTEVTEDHGHSGGGFLKAAAAGGLAATALGFLSRRRSQRSEDDRTSVSDGRHHRHHAHHASQASSQATSSYLDAKTDVGAGRQHTWRDRILTGLGVAAVAGVAKNLLGRRRAEGTEVSSYSSHTDGYTASRTDVSRRMEEGRAHGAATPGADRYRRSEEVASSVATPAPVLGTPTRHSRARLRKSGGPISETETESFYSPGKEKRKSHTVRNSIAAMGIAGFIKHKFSQRRERREEERIEEMMEQDRIQEERMQRRQSPSGSRRYGRQNSFSESEMSPVGGSTPAISRHGLHPGTAAATAGAAGAVGAATASSSRLRPGGIHIVDDRADSVSTLPPPPPIGAYHDSSGSEAYTSPGGTQRHRHHTPGAGLGVAGPSDAHGGRRQSVNSPPLSIKMRMRTDNGRQQVTLQRISPSEAAAERQAAARRGSRPPADSISSLGASGDERWRRTEALERQQDAEMRASRQSVEQAHNMFPGPPPGPPPGLHSSSPAYKETFPPPPPITGSGLYDTGESAAGSRADSNRRRRRAERARAEQAGRAGNRVEFS